MKEEIIKSIKKLLTVATVAVLMSGVLAFPVLFLWNWLMTSLFGLTGIDAIQAFGLLLLTNVFFNLNFH